MNLWKNPVKIIEKKIQTNLDWEWHYFKLIESIYKIGIIRRWTVLQPLWFILSSIEAHTQRYFLSLYVYSSKKVPPYIQELDGNAIKGNGKNSNYQSRFTTGRSTTISQYCSIFWSIYFHQVTELVNLKNRQRWLAGSCSGKSKK